MCEKGADSVRYNEQPAVNSMSVIYNRYPIPPRPRLSEANLIREKRNNYLSACPGGTGCLPARIRLLPLIRQYSMRMMQPSVGKRRRLAAFRTINCREQLISAQGCLERVLKAANRLRLMARRFSRTRFIFTISDWRAYRILDVQGIQRYWNSQLA